MYKFNAKQINQSIIFCLLFFIFSYLIKYTGFNIQTPVVLIMLISLSAFMMINLLIYKKANAKQVILISTYNFTLLIICGYILSLLSTSVKVFPLNANTNIIPFITLTLGSITAIKFLMQFVIPKSNDNQTPIEKEILNETIENIQVQTNIKPQPKEPILQENSNETHADKVNEKQADEITITQPSLNKKQPETSDYISDVNNIPDNEFEITSNETINVQTEDNNESLNELPDLALEETLELNFSEETKAIFNKVETTTSKLVTHIRASLNKQNFDDEKRHMSAIGALLLNQRDLENIIEANALIQDINNNSKKIKIIYAIDGDDVSQELNNIKQDINIDDVLLVDSKGILKASNSQSNEDIYSRAAISSLIFQVIENFISQLWEVEIQSICIESNVKNLLISKANNHYTSIIGNKNFCPVKKNPYTNIQTTADGYFTCFASTNGSNISMSEHTNLQNCAEIQAAIFENIKSFITALNLDNLENISIYTKNRVVFINQSNDKIVLVSCEDSSLLEGSTKYCEIKALNKIGT